MQTTLFTIWTQVTNSISYGDNCYAVPPFKEDSVWLWMYLIPSDYNKCEKQTSSGWIINFNFVIG